MSDDLSTVFTSLNAVQDRGKAGNRKYRFLLLNMSERG